MPQRKKKDGEATRVVFYIRYSSGHQDGENSKEGQFNALKDHADANGQICVGVYTDEAVSGKRDDRRNFNRMMRDGRSRERPYDEVLVWKFDRLGRRSSTVDRRATELEQLGVAVTAVQQPIDGKPSVVRFVRRLLSDVAEFFSDNMGEDIARGRKTSASHGVWTNSSVPFGLKRDHRWDREKLRPFLIPDPETEWIIRRMFALYLEGTSTSKIAAMFREEKVPNATDKPWTREDVTRRLKNIAYAGFVLFGRRSQFDDTEVLAPWPEMALVDLADYNRAQEIMASRTPKKTHPREVASVHLLAGRVFCDECDAKMSPTGGQRSYYNCNKRRSHLSSCDTPNPRAELLDAAVLRHIVDNVLTKENTERVLAIVAKSQTETMVEVEDELKSLNLEIESLKGARKNLLKLVEDEEEAQWGDIAERLGEIRETLTQLEANALEARAKVSNEKALISSPEKVIAYAQSLRTYLRSTNLDLAKEILRELKVQVRVLPGEEPNTATIIIKYRIPAAPRGWTEKTDIEELWLKEDVRSLEVPAKAGIQRTPSWTDFPAGKAPLG